MGEITLYPGRVVARWYDDEETVWPAGVLDLSKYFFYSLELDPDFTFGDLFRLLDREDAEFLEVVLGEHVVALLEEARRDPEPDDGVALDFLRVSSVHEDGRLRREFHGWGPWDEPYDGAWEENPACPKHGSISVSLTPVNQLLHVPLRYDPEVIFLDSTLAEIYRTRIDITLIEFLKAIFFDLTFYGPPDERDGVLAELDRCMEEIERGEAKLTPTSELFKDARERRRRAE